MKDSSRIGTDLSAENYPPDVNNASHGGISSALRYWLRDLVLSIGLAGLVIIFLYQPVKVEGTSMLPRLTDQERVFINKYIYHFESINRGDIVVFRYPLDTTKSYIKRVIGLPGETVELRSGHVFIDGMSLTEPYVLSTYRDRENYGPFMVPPGEFYVLGDHRNSSNDSRLWGTITRRNIYGKAVLVYWPMKNFGIVE